MSDVDVLADVAEHGRPREKARRPLVIAHRGSSGYRPEHTLAAYALAIQQGADYIEPDLVSTQDGVLVARHENEIGETTDVAARPEFADRRTSKWVGEVERHGWFTEDFTLAELKSLHARERLPAVRPANTRYDGLYEVATFDEILDLAAGARTNGGGAVGVYPETKNPSYFRSLGLGLEEPMLRALHDHGYAAEGSPVFLQSFEPTNLKELAGSGYRLIQLIEASGAPYDLVAAGDPRTYADLVTDPGLAEISTYAHGVGLPKALMIPRDDTGALGEPTRVIEYAHRHGLLVHGWTFRRENVFLPVEFRRGTDPSAEGDLAGEINAFLAAGMDALFVDNPDLAQNAALV